VSKSRDNNVMHAKPGLRAGCDAREAGLACGFFCLQEYRPGSVITDVISLDLNMTLALLLLFTIPIAQEPAKVPTAESVLARYVNAKGGKNRLLAITNYSLFGTIEIVNEDERTEFGNFQIYQTDGQSVTRITLPDGTRMSHGTDGKIAWSISEHGTANIMKDQEALDFVRHHKTLHESLAWPDQFEAIKYAGKKTIDDVETNHLIFIASNNRQINRYFSVKSGLLIRDEQFVGPANSFQVSNIADYHECPNGTMVSRTKTISGDRFWGIKDVSSNIDGIKEHLQLPEAVTKCMAAESAK